VTEVKRLPPSKPCHHGRVSLLFLVIGVAVIGGVVLLATGRVRASLPEPDETAAMPILTDVPVGDLSAGEIEQVRIDQALRGYRMDEVDELVDRLGAEIAVRDELLAQQQAEIDRLRGPAGA